MVCPWLPVASGAVRHRLGIQAARYSPAAIACDDGDLSTKVDICDGLGGCAGQPYTCEATQCDADSVPNGADCDVFPKAQGIGCDDGDPGTKDDLCDGQSGCAGTAYTCEPGTCELGSTRAT